MFHCMFYRRGPLIYNKTYNKIPRGGVQYDDEWENMAQTNLLSLR